MNAGDLVPSSELADRAINIAVSGSGSRITVVAPNVNSSGGNVQIAADSEAQPDQLGLVAVMRRPAAIGAGLASVAGFAFALAQWQGWL